MQVAIDAAGRQPVAASGRDSRIDALRGVSLVMILVDHIPPNALNWYTLHNFSLSDAAEIFVFLAGTSSMLAYGRAFERKGVGAGLRQIGARCAMIYGAQVALFLISLGVSWTWRHSGHPTPVYGPLAADGWDGILRGLLLDALPAYLDILPLYIVLMASFPLVYAAARVSPWLALALSGSLWLEVNIWHNLNLPNMLRGDGWYFNPFAWQFLFTIGAVSAELMRPVRLLPSWVRVLRGLCLAYLAFGFVEALNYDHWGLPDFSPLDIGEPDKTLLSPLRLLSILALVFLVFTSPAMERLSASPVMRPFVSSGRHSLEVFSLGCLLAYASRLAFIAFGTGWPLQVGLNVIGIGFTFAAASYLDRRQARAKGRIPG